MRQGHVVSLETPRDDIDASALTDSGMMLSLESLELWQGIGITFAQPFFIVGDEHVSVAQRQEV